MPTDSIAALEQRQFEEDDSQIVPPTDIVAYNELRSCADLYRMHTQAVLDIKPEFQRDIVWNGPAQTRFIDSLIKQLPIPSMCFALDHREQKWIVIDGLQRISTIIRFLDGQDWTLSKLDDIDPAIAGKSAAAIKTSSGELKKIYSRVENLTIPITVLRCDFSRDSHLQYLFTIFHRLNAGGMKLNNQEIRNCIYTGPFNDLLKDLDKYPAWRRLNRMRPKESYRYTKQELQLRFFAFLESRNQYQGHLAKFLNSFMHRHRYASESQLAQFRSSFVETVEFIDQKIFDATSPPKLSVTLLEGLLVGVGANLTQAHSLSPKNAKAAFARLSADEAFSEPALREGLSKRARVVERLRRAVEIFAA